MKIAAIIAEYNPFHNGHLYQLQKIKESIEDAHIIVILSTSFTQRGIPGICDQHLRAQMAIQNGADLVLELPLFYSCGSAEYFAKGSVSMLEKLGIVDYLVFGSEAGSIEALKDAAYLLNHIDIETDHKIKALINQGIAYPKARASALNLKEDLLNNPNNILAIEYLRELDSRKSNITPLTIKREGNDYNDATLSQNGLSSAKAIRSILNQGDNFTMLKHQVPQNIYELINNPDIFQPLFMDDFSDYLFYQLQTNAQNGYSGFYDVGDFLSNTFSKNLNSYTCFSDFVLRCKSKNYTYTRINRALTHIMLNMREDFCTELIENDYIQYARLLGFSQNGKDILSLIKKNSSIPIISKASNAASSLQGIALNSFNQDVLASNLYEGIRSRKYKKPFINEFSKKIIGC